MSLHTLAMASDASVSLPRYIDEPVTSNAAETPPVAVSYIFPSRPRNSSDPWNRPLWWSAAAIFLTTVSWGFYWILDAPINFQDIFRRGLTTAGLWNFGGKATTIGPSASKAQPGDVDTPDGAASPLNQKDATASASPKESTALVPEEKNSAGTGQLNYHAAGVPASNRKYPWELGSEQAKRLEAASNSGTRFGPMILSGPGSTFLDALAEGRLVDVLPPEVLARLSLNLVQPVPSTQKNPTSVSASDGVHKVETSTVPQGTSPSGAGQLTNTGGSTLTLAGGAVHPQGLTGAINPDVAALGYNNGINLPGDTLTLSPGVQGFSGQITLQPGAQIVYTPTPNSGAVTGSIPVPAATPIVSVPEPAPHVLYNHSESQLDFLLYEHGGKQFARFSAPGAGILAEGQVTDAEALIDLAKSAQVNKKTAPQVVPKGD